MTTTEHNSPTVAPDDPHAGIKKAYILGYEAGQYDAQHGRANDTLRPVVRHDVPCPSWCGSEDGHLEERWVEDTYHRGPELPPVELWNDAGGALKALELQV